ncbi:hypothetical protein QQF64_017039 [Cirrhinus molitorella]|uniref:Uncharacterized protein n=1 Tax=Cirrhinus molitorella TaxID=172907 RepID=A0ABR3LJX2_9TELE
MVYRSCRLFRSGQKIDHLNAIKALDSSSQSSSQTHSKAGIHCCSITRIRASETSGPLEQLRSDQRLVTHDEDNLDPNPKPDPEPERATHKPPVNRKRKNKNMT